MRPFQPRAAILLAASVALMPLFAMRADACTCTPPAPPCEAYWEASAVFDGVVKEVVPTTIVVGEGPDRTTMEKRLARFSVENAFRGVKGTDVDVVTGLWDADCGYNFTPGERYLVYAYKVAGDERLMTSICSRTKPISDAEEDLAYIRTLSEERTVGGISGVVRLYTRDEAGNQQYLGPAGSIRVAFVSVESGERYAATTDAEGRYELSGLPAGTYRVRTQLLEGFRKQQGRTQIHPGGCTRLDIDAESGGQTKSDDGGPGGTAPDGR